jgi:flagellar hook-length control protein FliK
MKWPVEWMLKEEHVKAIATDFDLAGSLSGVFKQKKNEAASGLFEALLTQLSQRYTAEPLAATGTEATSTRKTYSTTSSSLTTYQGSQSSPIQRLKASLEDTGQPLERFKVASEDRDKLKEVLVMSGYSESDAEEIIKRASEKDGTVNLGAVFNVMSQYTPSEGPVFLISAKDKPVLMQVLKELGLPDAEVRKFVDGLAQKGDMLVVSGLPKMLARAMELQETRDGSTQIDKDTLRDLLSRIGLNSKDIDTLLTKATDSQGRISPEALLQVFEQAAASQDSQVKKSLQELAQNLRVTDGTQEQATDAERIKAQVMQFLQKVEIQAQPQEKPEFAQALKDLLQTNLNTDDDMSQEEVARLVKEQAATDSVRESTSKGESGETKSDSQGQTWAGLASAKAAVAQNVKGTAQGDSSSQAAVTASSGADGRLASAARAAAARSTLPTYVVRQVSEQIALMAKNNQSQLRLALKPPELGELTIKLSLREGVLKATLVADNASAKHALEAGLNDLKQQLAQQGLKAERLEVVISPDAERREARSGEQGSEGQSQKGSTGNSLEVEMEEEEIDPALLSMAGSSGRVNVFA